MLPLMQSHAFFWFCVSFNGAQQDKKNKQNKQTMELL